MGILHYFSKDADKRAKFIFNLIAPIYTRVDKKLADNFRQSAIWIDEKISLKDKQILDVGTGTGAWAASLKNAGATAVTGIDFSHKMLAEAKKNHKDINFEIGDAENLHQFADNSFDIVTASYVLHGVKSDKRIKILSEMKRVSRKYVILQDFAGKTPLFIKLLETMERSDYKNFKIEICNELKSLFPKAQHTEMHLGSGVYIAEQ